MQGADPDPLPLMRGLSYDLRSPHSPHAVAATGPGVSSDRNSRRAASRAGWTCAQSLCFWGRRLASGPRPGSASGRMGPHAHPRHLARAAPRPAACARRRCALCNAVRKDCCASASACGHPTAEPQDEGACGSTRLPRRTLLNIGPRLARVRRARRIEGCVPLGPRSPHATLFRFHPPILILRPACALQT